MTNIARTLVLVSNPLDASINLGDDLARLREAVADLSYAAQFDIHVAEAQRIGDLLTRADRAPYDILHYLGHGDLLQNGTGVLWFEDETGGARAVRDLNLLTSLKPTDQNEFKLALLSACHSESVAPAMLALGIRHIIAIEADQSVYEIAAVAFYRRFYLALLTGATVQAAFTAGRNAVINDERLGTNAGMIEAAMFKLLPEGVPHDERLFADLADGDVTTNDLPVLTGFPFDQQPIDYVGRNEDLRDVLALLNKQRAATVLGVSGVGKTELAKQTARWLTARRRIRPDRVGFAALLNANNVDDARIEIAKALRLPPDDTRDNSTLAQQCPRGALVIVDEAEGVMQADGHAFRVLLNALIDAPARPLVIVTSQTDPNTPKAPPVQVRRLSDEAAFRLFALNATVSMAQVRRMNTDDLLAVLGYVDRLPRAIELIARAWRRERGANADTLDLGPLVRQLRAERDRVMRDPDYPAEVKSVTIGIRLAYDRLRAESEDAARLYAQLALFPGGVSKAGLAVIFGPQATEWATRIQAQSLVEMPYGRFLAPLSDLLQLPAPFRFFAERQLAEGVAAARAAIGADVMRYYLDFDDELHRGWVSVLNEHITSGGAAMGAFIARYDAELPSIEAWLDWGYDHEACTDGHSRAARVTAQLQNLYVVTGELRHQRARFDRAFACAIRCKDRLGEANVRQALGDLLLREDDLKGARAQYDAALEIYPQVGARLGEANVRKALGDLLLREADLKGARAQYDAALEIYPQVGDRLGEANVRKALGDLLLREDDLKGARAQYDAALEIYPQVGDRLGEANVRQALGDLLLREDDLKGARAQYDAALEIYPQVGARLGEANVRKALGDLLLREDDLKGARAQYDAALEIYPQVGDRLGEANVRQALGDLLLREADLKGARAQYDAALEIYPQVGARLGEANVRKALGDLLLREADLKGARAQYDAALEIYPQVGDRLGEANVRQALGDLLLREADLKGARAQYDAALEIYPQVGARLGEANVRQALGDLLLREADLKGARAQYDAALEIYPQVGDRLGEANVRKALGDLLLREDDLKGARAQYDAALEIYPQVGARLGEANVRKALGDLLLREADLKGARAQYDAALEIYPQVGARLGEANVRKALGDLLLREADLKGARAQYDAALEIYPQVGDRLGEANVRKALGNLALAEKRIEDAIRFYTEAAVIHRDIQDRLGLAGSFGYLARAYLAAENPAQAVLYGEAAINLLREIDARFGQAIALNDQGDALYALQLAEPAFAAWWQALGLAQRVNPGMAERLSGVFGQIKQALGEAEFEALTARLAQDAEGLRLAGVQAVQARQARAEAVAAAFEHYNAKRYPEARAAFEEILNVLPTDPDALNGLGNTLESLKQDEAALEAYGRAIAAQPELAMLRRNRASVLLRLGRFGDAEADIAEAVRLEPEHAFTRARQGYLALARGQFAQAEEHLRGAAASDDGAGWQLGLALAQFGQDQADAALDTIRACIARTDADDRAEARVWLERSVGLKPELAEAALAVRQALA